MKVFLSGQAAFGQAVYTLLKLGGHEVAAVSAPMLNGDKTRPDRLRSAAAHDGVPLVAGRLSADVIPAGVDLIIAAHSHDFISKKMRDKTTLGAIGYHPSLLPRHRGRDAVRWTIRMGDPVTGGTVFWLNDRVDAGDIAAQEHVMIPKGMGATELWREHLFPMGLSLIATVLADLGRGVIRAVPQDERCATWEPSIGREPLFRPDLPQLGPPPEGYTVIKRDDRATADLADVILNYRAVSG